MTAAVLFALLSNFTATAPPLNGGFIQYESASFNLGRNDWDGVINRMDGLEIERDPDNPQCTDQDNR